MKKIKYAVCKLFFANSFTTNSSEWIYCTNIHEYSFCIKKNDLNKIKVDFLITMNTNEIKNDKNFTRYSKIIENLKYIRSEFIPLHLYCIESDNRVNIDDIDQYYHKYTMENNTNVEVENFLI